MKLIVLAAALCLAAPVAALAQRPDTVFFEELTFDETRDAIKAGARNVVLAVGGLDADAAQSVSGKANADVAQAADRIARLLGDTLVAPVIPYAPGGLLRVQDDRGFAALLDAAAASLKGSGFRTIFLLGGTLASQPALESAAERLSVAWKDANVRVVYLGAFSGAGQLEARVERAVSQVKAIAPPLAPPSQPAVRQVAPRDGERSRLFLEDLAAGDIRSAIQAGSTTLIVPTGGTEKNGFHMVLGKHNVHVRAGAELMAKKLGDALVAPVLPYVPEGQATEAGPGVLSCARECFEPVVESIARGARELGFTQVLLIGDNGGNQTPLGNVATRLNQEWDGSGVKVFALPDFYEKSHEYQDAYFLALHGWDSAVVGSHAGIKDTSQMLHVRPEGVRRNRIAASVANKEESGISGDPTKASAEFGRIALEFKANAAIAQYRALTAPSQRGRRESRGER